MNDLAVDSMPTVHILVHTDSAFRARWSDIIGHSGIAFQVKALANGTNEIHVYGPWATQHASELPSAVLHEFAHCVTLQMAFQHGDSSHAPGTAAPIPGDTRHASDRWLSEAIALYEAGQSTDVNLVGALRGGDYPTLAQLSDPANSLIYSVGYRLMEYVRKNWGTAGVVRLVLAHGNVQQALDVSPGAFEDAWYDWIVKRYLILNPKIFGNSRYSTRPPNAGTISK